MDYRPKSLRSTVLLSAAAFPLGPAFDPIACPFVRAVWASIH